MPTALKRKREERYLKVIPFLKVKANSVFCWIQTCLLLNKNTSWLGRGGGEAKNTSKKSTTFWEPPKILQRRRWIYLLPTKFTKLSTFPFSPAHQTVMINDIRRIRSRWRITKLTGLTVKANWGSIKELMFYLATHRNKSFCFLCL